MECTQGEQHQNNCLCLGPSPPGLGGSGGRGVLPICTLRSCAPAVPLGALSGGWILESKDGLPWSLTSLPRCCGPAETGSEGAREEAAGAVWTGTWLPSSKAPTCPGCHGSGVLISGCPRLGAEHALGMCHEALGILQQSQGGQGRKRGIPHSPLLCPFSTAQAKKARKNDKFQQLPWCLVTELLVPISLAWVPWSQELSPHCPWSYLSQVMALATQGQH